MRHTWHQIQQMYPEQWVLMKGTLSSVDGNIISAEEVIPYADSQDINRFGQNSKICCYYTGDLYGHEEFDFCGYEEPVEPILDEEDMYAHGNY